MIDYLSYSSINTYLACPEHWRRKYILKQPTISTPALVFGGAFHNTLEKYIAQPKREISLTDLWPDIWQAKLEAEPNVDWGEETPTHYYREGLRLLGNDEAQVVADSIIPLVDSLGPVIERRVEMRVPGVPVPVIGYIDVITEDGIPGDFKTSSAAWSTDKAKEEMQALFYLAALDQSGYKLPDLTFRHYVFTKTKQPKVQVIDHRHSWNEVLWVFQLVRRVWNAIEREAFPLNPSGWMCSPKYCSFWSTCRAWAYE